MVLGLWQGGGWEPGPQEYVAGSALEFSLLHVDLLG